MSEEQTNAVETTEAPEAEVQSQEQETPTQEQDNVEESTTSEEAGTEQEETQGEEQPQSEGTPKTEVPKDFGSKEEWLGDLIRKGEENPAVVYTDEELDLLEEYYNGKIKPNAKSPDKDESSEEEGSSQEGEEESPETETEEEDSVKKASPPSSIDQQVMSELGAKTKTEILDKIKGLRKAISGKLEKAPEYQKMKKDTETLSQRVKNEMALWEDFRAGKQEAVDFVKKNYIPDLDAGKTEKPQLKTTSKKDRLRVDESELIDEHGAKHINSVIDTLYDKLEEQNRVLSELKADKIQHREKMTEQEVQTKVVDEMVQVAEQLPHLKNIKNIRQVITKWRDGNDDPRMEYFNDLFEIANKEGVTLVTASDIDRGRKSSLKIEQAKTDAKKEVYNRKPNRSLSEVQGKKGEFKQYSDADIQQMVYGDRQMPESWFDDKDNLIPSRIPKRAHKYFGIK